MLQLISLGDVVYTMAKFHKGIYQEDASNINPKNLIKYFVACTTQLIFLKWIPHRIGQKRRFVSAKITVFGLLKRGDKGCTKIVKDTKTTSLIFIIQSNGIPDSTFPLMTGGPIIF